MQADQGKNQSEQGLHEKLRKRDATSSCGMEDTVYNVYY